MNLFKTGIFLMKILCIGLCAVLLIFSSSPAAENSRRCYMCGMDSAKSQTEFAITFSDGDVEYACCLHCLYMLQKTQKDHRISKLQARDFSSGKLVDARQAHYLQGSSLMPEGSMPPFFLAFQKKESAEKYRALHGGTVVTFEKAMEIAAQFDEKTAPQK